MSYNNDRADTSGYWEKGVFKSMIPYVLPDNCPPKAAKFFGTEHVSKDEKSAPEPTREVVSELYLNASEMWSRSVSSRPRVRPQFFGRGGGNTERLPPSNSQMEKECQPSAFDRVHTEKSHDMPEKAKGFFGVTGPPSPMTSADAKTSAAYICHLSPDMKSGRNSPIDLDVKGVIGESERCWA